MLLILEYNSLGEEEKKLLIKRKSHFDIEIYKNVLDIIERVNTDGIPAIDAFSKKFDNVELENYIVNKNEFKEYSSKLEPSLRKAFKKSYTNIKEFHKAQLLNLKSRNLKIKGTKLGFYYTPVERVGVYVPGGKAAYPSSVLMGATAAQVAGVPEIILVTPPDKNGNLPLAIYYCAELTGVSQIIKVGGAHGVAAAVLGKLTKSVDLIVGPGNNYVNTAKLILASQNKVKIDMPAGPSEIMVIADETANPYFVAADLLSQAEHGSDSVAVLLTCSREFAKTVSDLIEIGLQERPERAEYKTESIIKNSYSIVFEEWESLYNFANEFAPEHLELCVAKPKEKLSKIKNAGSVFLGHYAPVALGDYYSGTNHILPSGGSAKSYSGLGVDTFLKKITYQYPSKSSLKRSLKYVLELSFYEGFESEHGNSMKVRFQKKE